jgi:hypothetical protein
LPAPIVRSISPLLRQFFLLAVSIDRDFILACQNFFVCPSPLGGWIAKLGAREAGPYASRDLALRVVVAEAGQARSADQHIRIIVEDASGEVSAARCTCHTFEQKLAER